MQLSEYAIEKQFFTVEAAACLFRGNPEARQTRQRRMSSPTESS